MRTLSSFKTLNDFVLQKIRFGLYDRAGNRDNFCIKILVFEDPVFMLKPVKNWIKTIFS